MSKTLAGILEIGIGIALEFTPLNSLGTSLIVSGVATEAAALLAKSPKPASVEQPLGKPPVIGTPTDPWNNLIDDGANNVMAGHGLGRRGRDELFEIDRSLPVIAGTPE